MLSQGVLTGLGLGACAAVSLSVVATHYRGDMGVASGLGGSAGFAGAVVYTCVTWGCVRSGRGRMGVVVVVLEVGAVVVAVLMARPCEVEWVACGCGVKKEVDARSSYKGLEGGVVLLLAGLLVTAAVLPVLFLPLVLTRQPSPHRADTGAYALLALYGSALFSSALLPRIRLSHSSPRLLLAASALLSGVAMVPLIWDLVLAVAVPCAVVFGVGLGGFCVLWIRVVVDAGVRGGEKGWWKSILVAIGGFSTGCAVVGCAAVLEGCDVGIGVVFGVAAACLVVGGLILGTVEGTRYWSSCRIITKL